ncbi:CHAT domain-containing protein [Streptomyces spongiae]|uniref:CHAT domain-containing protein n=1 Tax=Streptomyces spongiae TaxID=565072 RepID=A0A5N8XVQ2_9ACTN|nr:CHAT domain-containing protein [Streptomyces spongiae]
MWGTTVPGVFPVVSLPGIGRRTLPIGAGEIDWFGETLGWAPQFLNAGAGAFVGTLWPVRSRSALQFAEAFYDQLITNRQPLGQASLAARQTIRDLHGGDPTWLAYAVYGSPAARVHTT